MALFEGKFKLDHEHMVNKINIICKDLKLLDEFLEQNNLHVKNRRPITQAIWCFEELSQHLGIEEVSLDNTLTDSNNQSIKSLLDESVDMSLASRQQKNIAYNSTEQLFVKINPHEVYKLSSKELRPNELWLKKPSFHKNIKTSSNIARASNSSQLAPESAMVEQELQHQHGQNNSIRMLRENRNKEELDEIKILQEAIRNNMHLFLDGKQQHQNLQEQQQQIFKSKSPMMQVEKFRENRNDNEQLDQMNIFRETVLNNKQHSQGPSSSSSRGDLIKKEGSKVVKFKSNPKE